jgi:hypothetical protein
MGSTIAVGTGNRAARGQQLLQRLLKDLGQRFGRGFTVDNLEQMRLFYLAEHPSGCFRHRKCHEP